MRPVTTRDFEVGTYSLPQAARRLGISRTHAYASAKTGTLAGVPIVKVGHRYVVSRAAIERLLQ